MRPVDIRPVLTLLAQCEGVGMRSADSPTALRRFLRRNPRLSVVAFADRRIVGCAFVGHDGRRGYLHHLAVDREHRRAGLGRQIVDRALAGLLAIGIEKVHCDVFRTNRAALRFWKAAGWQRRRDIARLSIVISDDPNA
ncbi:MAG: GNAT family N-acetyltransferase [Opitutaceae bacterium]|nr:GNAT family N-acetyltransferase [Opitutaceae bacterium]